MNKFNKSTILIDGVEVDRSKIVFVPKEKEGRFRTSDGARYYRDEKGCIRRVKNENKKKS